jgi:hypothetical protein
MKNNSLKLKLASAVLGLSIVSQNAEAGVLGAGLTALKKVAGASKHAVVALLVGAGTSAVAADKVAAEQFFNATNSAVTALKLDLSNEASLAKTLKPYETITEGKALKEALESVTEPTREAAISVSDKANQLALRTGATTESVEALVAKLKANTSKEVESPLSGFTKEASQYASAMCDSDAACFEMVAGLVPSNSQLANPTIWKSLNQDEKNVVISIAALLQNRKTQELGRVDGFTKAQLDAAQDLFDNPAMDIGNIGLVRDLNDLPVELQNRLLQILGDAKASKEEVIAKLEKEFADNPELYALIQQLKRCYKKV